MPSPITDAVVLGLINALFATADILVKRAAGETVTEEDLTALQAQTKTALDAAHQQIEQDRAKGLIP